MPRPRLRSPPPARPVNPPPKIPPPPPPPLDLSDHLLLAADGSVYLLAEAPHAGGPELPLPKGSPGAGASGAGGGPGPPPAPPPAPLTALHIQPGCDPLQGFSSSDQIQSHNTSAPPPAARGGAGGALRSYRPAARPPSDPKDGPGGGGGRAGRGAPFWLCLPCRLGFGRAGAFAAHARSHGSPPTPPQRRGLARHPAVLHRGPEGEPATLLSFLEPKTPPGPPPPGPLGPGAEAANEEEEEGEEEEGEEEEEEEEEEEAAVPAPAPDAWDPSAAQAKECPAAAGEAGPDWLPGVPEEDGGPRPPRNQSSPTPPARPGSPDAPGRPLRPAADGPAGPAFPGLGPAGHVSLLHSRNSCKTLKCPKCNWHYKYQQTLDVHMREKHPESNSHCGYCSAGGAHPRLARGESYNCGYKPYRCEACNYSTTTKGNLSIHMQSDKHLANLQGFQAGPGGRGSPPEAGAGPGDPDPKAKSSWQCKVCSYETNVSRNLRIHMTSEKHVQNVLLLHQGLPLGLPPGLLGPGPPPAPPAPSDLFQYYGPQGLGPAPPGPPGSGLRPEKPLEAQLLLNGFHPPGPSAHRIPAPAPDGVSPDPRPPAGRPPGPGPDGPPASPPPDADRSLKAFRCLVCQAFGTDSLELLLYHCSVGRSLPEAEWKEVAGDTHRCKLCCYGTQLKANFQLHLKTDKHAQKYQLVAHLREGGGGAPSPAPPGEGPPFGPVSPLHLRCNLCDFEANSKEKMQLHARGGAHEENSQLYQFLLEMEEAEAGADLGLYRCLLCTWETPSRLALLQHLRTPTHRDAHAQRRLQLLQSGRGVEEGLPALHGFLRFGQSPPKPLGKAAVPVESRTPEEASSRAPEQAETRTGSSGDPAVQTTVYCCPYCSFVSPACEQVRAHTVSQHAVRPKYRCPLCQEQLVGRPGLHFHLSHLHNVVPECVEKLLLVAVTVETPFLTKVLPGPSPSPPGDAQEPPTPEPESAPAGDPAGEGPHPTPAASPAPPPSPRLPPPEVPEQPPGGPKPPSPAPSPPARPEAQPTEGPVPAAGDEEGEQEEEEEDGAGTASGDPDPGAGEPAPADARPPPPYRKTSNLALDKFLDPARPYKCTVCKESFTQKNILLVHYNSVSHLHKMKKAAADPSAPARGEPGAPHAAAVAAPAPAAAADKPFKCAVCRVSYNQSSTLEIHMRSVLHQTRSRGPRPDPRPDGPEEPREAEPGPERRGPEAAGGGLAPGLPFLPPPPPALDLPRFPAPLFAPPVLPPFPLVPDSLLQLQQQQQLLLPFYLPDLQVGPKLALAGPTPVISLPPAAPAPPPPRAGADGEGTPPAAAEEGAEAGPASPPRPPPPSEAARTAARALLENFGFELVIQYNEGKQPAAAPPPAPPPPEARGPGAKLACGTCGKLFSNMLILKTHEEHVHRRFLPFEALSRYAAQFRKSYDSLYPPPAEAPRPPDGSRDPPGPEPDGAEERGRRRPREEGGEEEAGGGRAGGPPPGPGPGGRRFSRTKFTEFQSQALQSFFETSAYPKDGEVERLAGLLGLASRVVVVWFQNARQKARKSAGEGAAAGGGGGGPSACRRCRSAFPCVFELVRHLKRCYDHRPPEEEEEEGEEGEEEGEDAAAAGAAPAEEEDGEDEETEGEGDLADGERAPRPSAAEVPAPGGGEPEGPAAPPAAPVHARDRCAAAFPGRDLASGRRGPHLPPPPAPPAAPAHPPDPPPLAFGERGPPAAGPPPKRRHEDGSPSPTGSEAGGAGEGEPPRDKRLRTTILPEQLEILCRWYMQDSNPTRKMLDCISEEVGLKKRVVQVWFQNTRARERKGQFRGAPPSPAGKPPAGPPAPFAKLALPPGRAEEGREAPRREPPSTPPPGLPPCPPPGREAAAAAPPEAPPPPPRPPGEEGPEEPPRASPLSEAGSPAASGGDLSDSSASSPAEAGSPGGGGGPGGGPGAPDGPGQRRYRTQMSSLQLKIMKACYEAYRTPTMQECEVLGEEIGLPKRVIQVWFQNARAKEKKAKLQAGAAGEGPPPGGGAAPRTDCPYCDVKYDFYVSCRGHLFSRQHLARLKEAVRAQLKSESKCYDLAPAPEAAPAAPPPLGAAALPPRLAPVLLSGPALAQPPLGGLAPFNPGPAASPGLIGLAASVLPATAVVQPASARPGPPRPAPDQAAAHSAGPDGAASAAAAAAAGPPAEAPGDRAPGGPDAPGAVPAASADALKNLKALKATVPALLGGQFLPFPLPAAGGAAAPAVFGPQLPGAYFQQLYGMKKGLFPMNPVIPQTLIGLLPNALLPPPEPPAAAPQQPPGLPAPAQGDAGEADELLAGAAGISTVDVTHRYLCRQCKMAFEGEAPAATHQRSFCFFGRGPGAAAAPPPLRVPVCTYHCLACEVLLSGREALAAHLRSSAHRRKAGPAGPTPATPPGPTPPPGTAAAFAKEEARLPHTDSNPKTTSTSTLVAL
ncbi:zinc finger homeobox protein 2 [Ornithorhynchus anatinus]|uniref:zinc finger homeobox protein 2 n=1 Tax=Ornithorhynchus anatinus TaxID=9258 RepID=UPI0019D425F0|nr:zinc finger homeobox protein 2 [Ornithorhynchus anatinus]